MKTELWGTFSVRDHLRERPFVAEVLLYDRLMIPRPTTSDEERPEPGKEDQVKRWSRQGWKPGRLRRLLDIMQEGDVRLAVDLPWGEQARRDWANLYNQPDSEQIGAKRSGLVKSTTDEINMAKNAVPGEAPYIATGGLIALYIAREMRHDVARRLVALTKTPGTEIEPVIAYNSFRELKKEQALRTVEPDATPEEVLPHAMFGWKFFVPEDTNKSDYALLRDAVKLASRQDLRETRQFFHAWLKQMHEGRVDPETAGAEMLKMLKEYNAIVRGSGLKTFVRYAAKVAPIAAPLAGLLGPEIGVAAGVAGGSAPIIVEKFLPKKEVTDRLRPAAFVYQARRFFRKK